MIYGSFFLSSLPQPSAGMFEEGKTMDDAIKEFEETISIVNHDWELRGLSDNVCLEYKWDEDRNPVAGGLVKSAGILNTKAHCDCGNCDGTPVVGSIMLVQGESEKQIDLIFMELMANSVMKN
ncbi:hypothetical protein HOT82_gp145 [Gordonia phage Ronaldo]|uniref:Uncharacterized protein n=4 Tax=Ronaldovirus TaxID=2733205 RepID=A0A6B9LJX2_9CAUD|nr:hypothetical protein HOT81_gp142 [Gordonia phage Fryberger]YP_009807824.1 hypothetical protein HOT82_gp145 [Gordonia phage Ronaldo]QDH48468.1 hypothetical protein SEA_ZIKO_132 [Gordonia phage Ziko]QHB38244.1 hypothetical protein SEA_VOLT_133 [Gordonia phage Volt]QTF81914.1 hypothetical protein SEA_GUEY18_133 [Gordonia phage Guey18]AXN53541.1 hypothetical protein SEA_FRYBERGER_128 [Gordonia phage Fryberger]AXN53710.1 hypothetical protein SEA_RONALDO_130 [Gordonia phage Ronaldo]